MRRLSGRDYQLTVRAIEDNKITQALIVVIRVTYNLMKALA